MIPLLLWLIGVTIAALASADAAARFARRVETAGRGLPAVPPGRRLEAGTISPAPSRRIDARPISTRESAEIRAELSGLYAQDQAGGHALAEAALAIDRRRGRIACWA
jgi:hypothetical protein